MSVATGFICTSSLACCLLGEPPDHIFGVSSRREDGREDLQNLPVCEDQGQTLYEGHSFGPERGKIEGPHELQVIVAQQGERKMQPRCRLALVHSRLGAQAEDSCSQTSQLGVVVAEGARLGCASAGAGDLVPPSRQVPVGPPGERVAVHDRGTSEGREVDTLTRGRGQGHGRKPHAWQVVAGAVVFWLGQAIWELVDVGAFQARSRVMAALWPPTPRLAQRAACRSGTSRGSSTM